MPLVSFYPLKKPGNLLFSDVFRGCKKGQLHEMGSYQYISPLTKISADPNLNIKKPYKIVALNNSVRFYCQELSDFTVEVVPKNFWKDFSFEHFFSLKKQE